MTGTELGTLALAAISGLVGIAAYFRSNRRDDFDSLRDEQRKQYDELKKDHTALAEKVDEQAKRINALEEQVEGLRIWRTLAVRYITILRKAIEDMGGHPPEAPDGLDLEERL